jgi:hypothetical protein
MDARSVVLGASVPRRSAPEAQAPFVLAMLIRLLLRGELRRTLAEEFESAQALVGGDRSQVFAPFRQREAFQVARKRTMLAA